MTNKAENTINYVKAQNDESFSLEKKTTLAAFSFPVLEANHTYIEHIDEGRKTSTNRKPNFLQIFAAAEPPPGLPEIYFGRS